MTGAIDLTPDGKSLVVRFPYREDLVEEVRLIPGRRWDAAAKVWTVPVQHAELVATTFEPHGFCLAPEVMGLVGGSADDGTDAAGGERALPLDDVEPAAAPALSISALNERVRAAIRAKLPDPLWVVGEVLDFDKNAGRKHIFFSLVEKTEGHDRHTARVDVALFAGTWETLSRQLEQRGLELKDGTQIRALVRVDLYPASGRYQLVMEDIDPAFTLGVMALTREKILAELRELRLDRANVSQPIPQPTLRVGCLSSIDSDGWADFRRQLEASGLGFSVTCYDVRVQGPELRPTVLAGLRWFDQRRDDFDVLCIIRGGGSRSDLAWFDDRDVALAVARHPLPVVCGIGHQRDQSVLDLIARSQKTPTAVGAWLVESAREIERQLDVQVDRLRDLASDRLSDEKARVLGAATMLTRVLQARVGSERQSLAQAWQRVRRGARAVLIQHGDRRQRDAVDLRRHANLVLERAGARITACSARQRLLDPARVLERGYALVRNSEGRIVAQSRALHPGMELDISFHDGHAQVTTTRVFDDEADA